MTAEVKPIVDTPEWERYCRRLHATARLAEGIGRELVRASGGRKEDPEFRAWLHELGRLNGEVRDRAQQAFLAFAEASESGGAL